MPTEDAMLLWVVIEILQSILLLGLGAFIAYAFDRKLGEMKFALHKREQAALVAAVLAEWVSHPEDYKGLNKLVWEATLWLPDDLARDLNHTLSYHPGAKTAKELLVAIKTLMQGEETSLTAGTIVHFPKEAT